MRIQARAVVAALTGTALMMGAAACGGSDDAGSGDASEITYWSMWEEKEPQADVIKAAIEKYTADTGTKVKVEWQGREVLTKLQAAMRTSDVPDLVDQSFGRLKASLAVPGVATDVADVLTMEVPGEEGTKVADVLNKGITDLGNHEGKTFMVPYEAMPYAIFYNSNNVDLSGIKTWDEFGAKMEELKAARGGDGPITLDGDIPGYTMTWVVSGLIASLGQGELAKVAADKTGEAWNSPEVLTAVQNIAQMAEGGWFTQGSFSSKFPAIQEKFAAGDTDLMYLGSWLPGEISGSIAPDFTFGEIPFPSMGGETYTQTDAMGMAIPAKAKHVDAAKKFLTYLVSKDFQNGIVTETGNIGTRTDIAAPETMTDLNDALNNTTVVAYFDGLQELGSYQDDVMAPAAASLLSGEVTAEQFVTNMAAESKGYWDAQG